jgi:ABC-type polysaccharide/polyol phosphate transport system ATPase subunit
MEKIKSFRRQGRTMLCVSHASAMVLALCDRAIWLERGQVVMTGRASEVQEAYSARMVGA